MTLNKPAIVIALLLPLMAALSFGVGYSSPLRSRPNGTIVGTVLDCNNARIIEADITIENGEMTCGVQSNEDGKFEVSLSAGVYRITVVASGFRRAVYFSVEVRPSTIKRIYLHLEVAAPPGLVPAVKDRVHGRMD